jgi:hypothetical protein
MVGRSFSLTVEGRTYEVEIIRPGVISVDGNVFNVEVEDGKVRVGDETFVASLSKDFAVVGGRLYDTEWKVD